MLATDSLGVRGERRRPPKSSAVVINFKDKEAIPEAFRKVREMVLLNQQGISRANTRYTGAGNILIGSR